MMALRLAFAALAIAVMPYCASAQKYGTLRGRFVLKGKVPAPAFIIKAGKRVDGGEIKDPKICAAADLPSDALVIDAKSKGIGNIFVYLRLKAGEKPKVHPSLVKPPKKALIFDQVKCRFVPHALFLRTDQTVKILSADKTAHNFHSYPLENEAVNFTIAIPTRTGVPLTLPLREPIPMKIECDLHKWMSAYWLVLDHPYGAISVAKASKDKQSPGFGSFEIPKLPYGEYEFIVWHEKAGYISFDPKAKRGFMVRIGKPLVTMAPFEVPVEKFQSKTKK